MIERPISFRTDMVRAILDGRKTQTRRLVKPQPQHGVGRYTDGSPGEVDWVLLDEDGDPIDSALRCPYGAPGDRLWVRETWGLSAYFDQTDWLRGSVDTASDLTDVWGLRYRADDAPAGEGEYSYWRPSIHMPRWASRITLQVLRVWVERVQDISEADAIAEGIEAHDEDGVTYYGPLHAGHCDPRVAFRSLWESIYGPESWARNDWVWVCEFKVEHVPVSISAQDS